MIIGLTGKNGSGKGEVAEFLKKRGYTYFSLSDEIREVMKEKKMKEWNLIRSATAPDTIVAAVPAKTSWKKNFAHSGTGVQLIAL